VGRFGSWMGNYSSKKVLKGNFEGVRYMEGNNGSVVIVNVYSSSHMEHKEIL